MARVGSFAILLTGGWKQEPDQPYLVASHCAESFSGVSRTWQLRTKRAVGRKSRRALSDRLTLRVSAPDLSRSVGVASGLMRPNIDARFVTILGAW